MRFTFIFYIVFAASYDSALAHELEEGIHVITHYHFNSDESESAALKKNLSNLEKNGVDHSSSNGCPDSENGHDSHECHMGHCGLLPQVLSFSKERPIKTAFTALIQTFKSRSLEGLFRPPRHS